MMTKRLLIIGGSDAGISAGLRARECDPGSGMTVIFTVEATIWDHKVYYPGANALHIRVTGDRKTDRLLGAQIAGHWQAEVAKRMDVFAPALFHDNGRR